MKKTFKQLYKEHEGKISDKWSLYLDEMDRLLAPYQGQHIQLFEIGIQNGGSLEIFSKYFPKAEKIIGCDIDKKCEQLQFGDPRIMVIVGDANSDECQKRILRQSSAFDIIIDDGSHNSSDIVRSFARYFPHLSDNGIYVAEDLHASYWDNFEGGLHNHLSAMSFFKRLADVINYEHWRNNASRGNLLTKFSLEFNIEFNEIDLIGIHSIEFVNSLCIIRKLPPDKNVLGKRIITGMDEFVSSGIKKHNGTIIQQDGAVVIKDDTNFDVFELMNSLQSLKEQVTERDDQVQVLTAHVAERDQAVQTLAEQVAERNQVVQILTAQVTDRDQDIQSLTAQTIKLGQEKQTLENQLTQSQEEVLFYALSKSWRITRPLRKLVKFFKW